MVNKRCVFYCWFLFGNYTFKGLILFDALQFSKERSFNYQPKREMFACVAASPPPTVGATNTLPHHSLFHLDQPSVDWNTLLRIYIFSLLISSLCSSVSHINLLLLVA